jgi:4-hydroxybenzoate polyprenyltransferase
VKKLGEFVLFSSLFIAACAVALCIQTNLLLHLPLNSYSFYCFVFGATLVQYNLHYLVKTTAIKDSQRLQWSSRNKTIHNMLTLAGLGLILFSFFSFRLQHFIILGIMGSIAFLYSFPLLPFRKKRIKDYGFLKITTLALLWTLITVWFPVNRFGFDQTIFIFIFFKRLIFMFILCLLFDMRDIEVDSHENITTLPVFLGKARCYLLTYCLIVLFVVLCLCQFYYLPEKNILLAMLASAGATFVAVELTKKINSDFFYLAGIDGMMLLQAALVYVVSLKF